MNLRGVSPFLLLISILFSAVPARAEEELGTWERIRKEYSIENSIQGGFEYDSNVFKTFANTRGDMLLRLLLKSRGRISFGDRSSLGWLYRGGGKKFFERGEQDLFIQHIETPLSWRPHRRISFQLTPDFKYQNENNALGPQTTSADINEDYWSTMTTFSTTISLPLRFTLMPYTNFTYFKFQPRENFSFFRERGGVTVRHKLRDLLTLGTGYRYSRQQFQDSAREDSEHAISAFFTWLGVPLFSGKYTYQSSNSSDDVYAFTNHRVTFLLSLPLFDRDDSAEQDVPALLTVHVLGTLQLKDFPDVFTSTEEGERFLLTGAEDDNFNSMLIKVIYHPTPKWAIEAKFTRYSNELSTQEDFFNRSLLYGGVRFLF